MARILVVDDDPDMLLATRLCLESGGHNVIEARSGPEGLEAVLTDKPDLIVLDVMMGTTTEGFQVALKLRSPDPASEYKSYSAIPIIMLTAIHTTTPLRFGPDPDYLPADAFMDKPLDPDKMLKQVDTLLNK
jgi:CheY-like chemotaxis protein